MKMTDRWTRIDALLTPEAGDKVTITGGLTTFEFRRFVKKNPINTDEIEIFLMLNGMEIASTFLDGTSMVVDINELDVPDVVFGRFDIYDDLPKWVLNIELGHNKAEKQKTDDVIVDNVKKQINRQTRLLLIEMYRHLVGDVGCCDRYKTSEF